MSGSARLKRLEKKIETELGPSTEGPTVVAFTVRPRTPDECLVVADNGRYRVLTQEERDEAGTLLILAGHWQPDEIGLLPTKKLQSEVRAYRAGLHKLAGKGQLEVSE